MGGYNSLFYKKKPLFGLDIGSKTIKVMQLDSSSGSQKKLVCYGVGTFDESAIKDGVIVDYESLASSIMDLYQHNLIGKLTTNRVALTMPISRTFNKVITTPKVKKTELNASIEAEAEQYIPIALSDLYYDYQIISEENDSYEILIVAAPRKVVDSYMRLARLLGLEPAAFDTSITASARIFEKLDDHNDIPSVLIDFGTQSADISIYDKTIVVTNTIPGGGENFTDKIAKGLDVSHREAHIIKTKYGLGKSKKQSEILQALDEDLQKLVREIRKMLRYYEDRSTNNKKIGQIVTLGGGANMPGLTEYLVETLRLPVRTHNPWQKVNLGKLQPPTMSERSIYVTVAGLALITEKDIFSS